MSAPHERHRTTAGTCSTTSSHAVEVGALGEHLPRELQRVGHDLAKVTDADVDLAHGTAAGPRLDVLEDGLAEGELVHG